MMRNFIIFIALFSFLSCEKESGFIPEPDVNDPHYTDRKPELQWRANLPMIVLEDNYRIIDDLMIIYGYRRNSSSDETISAYHVDNGNLAWELYVSDILISSGGGPIQHFHVMKEGATLYFIDLTKGKTFLINAEDGNLIEMRSPNGINPLNHFTAFVIDHSYYHLDHKGEGQTALIKYDFISHEVEEVMDLSKYPIGIGISRAVYHENDNTLYLHANIDNKKYVLLGLDLDTKEVHELWGRPEIPNSIQFPNEEMLLIDDILIFEGSREEIYAVNRISGELEWIINMKNHNRLDNVFSHMGNVYLLISGKLVAIDHQTGDIKWRNNYTNIFTYISLHPDEDLLIGINQREASIYDLTNGQKLVEWNAAGNEEEEKPILRFTTYHEETNSIYIGTIDELMKYNWPLP